MRLLPPPKACALLPATADGWYDGRLPGGVWARYRVHGGWIVTAYATIGTAPDAELVGRWGEDEVVLVHPHVPTHPQHHPWRWLRDRLHRW